MEIDIDRTALPQPLIETVERLRLISGLKESDWLDLLYLSWNEYGMIRSGLRDFPRSSLENVAEHFDLTFENLSRGKVAFRQIQMGTDRKTWQVPDLYTKATHGRRRTTITSFEYIERKFGWRLRHDTLAQLGMSELILENEFAPISMRFLSDACDHLARRRFQPQDFFNMGAYSYAGNRHTILHQALAQFRSTQEVLEHMWSDLLPLYEQNCIYRFLQLTDTYAHIEVKSDPNVAEEMGVRHLGNTHICALKAGMMASAPCYIGLPLAQVEERTCVHRGDGACLFEIQYPGVH